MGDGEASGFLSRWARRKEQVRAGAVVAPEAPLAAVPASADLVDAPPAVVEAPAAEPAPTLADVALLTRDSDYARFVGAGVDEGVKRAAMKKLFTDPHFNVMDGLDTYIADYGKPDPIPLSMLRQMNQSKFLRLFDDDEKDEAKQRAELPASTAPTEEPPSPPDDDDADLRLQQDHAVGQPGPDQGAGA